MENKPQRSIWPYVLTALAGMAIYLAVSIEVEGPEGNEERPVGGLAEIEGLAQRDDINILFLLVDTLRAERMEAYGYERATTPFLASLASSGIRFNEHTAQSSWTKTSMASLWTGLNPIRSGVTKFNHTVSPQVTMPAEILSEAGFKTVGLYRNGWVHGYFGFDQGFEKYYRPAAAPPPPSVQRLRPNSRFQGSDEKLIGDAIEFLRIHGNSSRWFLYLHLMDIHEYTYDDESALFGTTLPDLYDNSILRTDWVISKLYAYLEKRELLDNTLIVLLSDHGEAFGERGFEGHARAVFPETTETPLIISLPFQLAEPLVIEAKTANVDVWPTLLDLLGLPVPPGLDGRSRRSDILASISGEEVVVDSGSSRIAFLDENWGQPGTPRSPALSISQDGYRYVVGRNNGGKKFEVLIPDTENSDLGESEEIREEILDRFRALAAEELGGEALYESDTYDLDEMQLDQLRALGYELP